MCGCVCVSSHQDSGEPHRICGRFKQLRGLTFLDIFADALNVVVKLWQRSSEPARESCNLYRSLRRYSQYLRKCMINSQSTASGYLTANLSVVVFNNQYDD